MRVLFVKKDLVWPRSSGHDVHTYYMMKAFGSLGHDIALATVAETTAAATDGLPLKAKFTLANPGSKESQPAVTSLQQRFQSYWGVSTDVLRAFSRISREFDADVAVIGGLDALPYFPWRGRAIGVWYAADEWMLHHFSQLKIGQSDWGENLKAAAVKGVYERAFRRQIDRTWVVSESDRRAMTWIGGMRNVDVLPNGVDGQFFQPTGSVVEPATAVFWGRLDFGPNIQALEWFVSRVWPAVRQRTPDARLTIVGFQPGAAVLRLAKEPGIRLEPNIEDLRPVVTRHAIAVLPFVSGAGIKNKLLEAAALGMPIVCTPTAARGLKGDAPVARVTTPQEWSEAMVQLWTNAERRQTLGAAAREWVLKHHTWESVAREAASRLEAMLAAK